MRTGRSAGVVETSCAAETHHLVDEFNSSGESVGLKSDGGVALEQGFEVVLVVEVGPLDASALVIFRLDKHCCFRCV